MPQGVSADSGPIVEVRGLKVHFPLGGGFFGRKASIVKAVDGVGFELQKGETLGIVGESGCGKSTLARALLRLIPVTSGSVMFKGRDLAAVPSGSLNSLRRHIQMVFQDPLASLDPRMNIGEIVAEPLKTHHRDMGKRAVKERVREMLAKVGLGAEMINRYPHELSGGQCQRVGIARAMVLSPDLVVCDEPVSALDVSIQAQIVNLLRDLQRELRLSLIFISHDLSVVKVISHRIVVLYLGRVMEAASRDGIYGNPRHPYTQALLSAIPIPDPVKERSRKRIMLEGELPSPASPPPGCIFHTRCPRAQRICSEREPVLERVVEGHEVACHFWRS